MPCKPLLLALALATAAIAPFSVARAAGQETAVAADPAAPAPSLADLDRFIAARMEEAGIVGVGAAIVVDGEVAWQHGYGYADRASRRPYTPGTVQNIASISKTFTGVAMLQAVEDGLLSLDADIDTYLPFAVVNPHDPDGRITLRDLATHSSGLVDRMAVYRETYHYRGETPEPLADFLRGYLVPGGAHYSPDNFLDAAPGEQVAYSNIGAALVGLIVERAVGEPLPDYAAKRIFAPLGMASTVWRLADVDPATQATLYIAQDGLTSPIEPYEGTTYPEGGVRTSVADLSRFFLALLGDGSHGGGRLLEPASVRELRRFQFDAEHKPENLDLAEENAGLFWATKFNGRFVGHGGTDPGLKTEMIARPGLDVGMIVFTNTSLSGEEMRHYVAILLEVWKYAEALAGPPDPATGGNTAGR